MTTWNIFIPIHDHFSIMHPSHMWGPWAQKPGCTSWNHVGKTLEASITRCLITEQQLVLAQRKLLWSVSPKTLTDLTCLPSAASLPKAQKAVHEDSMSRDSERETLGSLWGFCLYFFPVLKSSRCTEMVPHSQSETRLHASPYQHVLLLLQLWNIELSAN